MTIKLDTHKTEFPMDTNDTAKNQGETKRIMFPLIIMTLHHIKLELHPKVLILIIVHLFVKPQQ